MLKRMTNKKSGGMILDNLTVQGLITDRFLVDSVYLNDWSYLKSPKFTIISYSVKCNENGQKIISDIIIKGD